MLIEEPPESPDSIQINRTEMREEKEIENIPTNGILKMVKPGVITVFNRDVDIEYTNRHTSTELIVKPIEMKEHSDDEWYPPTPPLYDVTDKLR